MNSLPFHFEQPIWLLLPVFLVSVSIAVFLYYKKKSEYPKTLSWVLFTVRFISVFIIGLLLMNVFFFHQEKQLQKPVLVVAIDESESMMQNADSTSLKKEIRQKANQFKSELEEVYQIDFLGFHQDVLENPEYEFKGKRTDLGKALQYIEDKYYMLPLEAVVLISDGQNNQGQNPRHFLESTPNSVYPVLIGDTSKPSDLWVDAVYFNRVVKQNADFPVDVVVQASQLSGQKGVVKIKHNGMTIAQKEIAISTENESREIRFEISEKTSGMKRYEAEVICDAQEQNTLNNSSDFYLQVVESGQKVMIIGNNPHPDLGAIASALRKVDGLEVKVQTLSDYPFKIEEEQLLILHGLPSKDERSKALMRKKELKSKAIWYIWSTSTDLNDSEFPYFVTNLSGFEYAEPNPVESFNDFLLPGNWQSEFSDYPPLYVPYVKMTAKKQMSHLFTQNIRGYDLGEPLWSFWEDQGINKSYLAGEGIWKWKLNNYQKEGNHHQFNDLVKRVSKYLLTGVYNDRFNLQYQSSYNETDQVIIEAQVLNKAFENISDAEVSMELTEEQGNNYPYQFSNHNNNYQLDLGYLKSGIYQFKASAKTADTILKENGQFVVESWNMETAQTGANFQLMSEIASITAGKTYFISNIDAVIQDLKESQNTAARYQYIEKIVNLIDIKYLLILLLTLLSAEWFLRKYFGGY